MCPVSYFLGLAIADGVFQGISEAAHLGNVHVPSSCNSYTLRYKAEKANLSLFCSDLST